MNLDLATQTQNPRDAQATSRVSAIEERIAWMKQTSPDWQTADPYAIDWQAIKAEGRRY